MVYACTGNSCTVLYRRARFCCVQVYLTEVSIQLSSIVPAPTVLVRGNFARTPLPPLKNRVRSLVRLCMASQVSGWPSPSCAACSRAFSATRQRAPRANRTHRHSVRAGRHGEHPNCARIHAGNRSSACCVFGCLGDDIGVALFRSGPLHTETQPSSQRVPRRHESAGRKTISRYADTYT